MLALAVCCDNKASPETALSASLGSGGWSAVSDVEAAVVYVAVVTTMSLTC